MRNQPPDGFYELVAALVAADKKRGLSVEAIADGMGINRSRLYRYLGSGRTDGWRCVMSSDPRSVTG